MIPMTIQTDTIAAIAGALSAATPGMEIPRPWAEKVFAMLKPDLKGILVDFEEIYCKNTG